MKLNRLVSKVWGQMRLMRRDPEAFAANVLQYTDPAKYEARLLDIADIRRLAAVADPTPGRRLNIVLPAIGQGGMTGGPNTALNLGCRLAMAGIPVRFISADTPVAANQDGFWTNVSRLTGNPGRIANASLVSAADAPLPVRPDDQFMATFWTTAYQVAPLLALTRSKDFIYLIQDFEPGFYAWSSNHVMAHASYDLPFVAIVNEATLADYLSETRAGRFADAEFRRSCIVFEPAIDRAMFHPGQAASEPATRRRRLLVYARPKLNARNLLGMAIAALRGAVAAGALEEWDILAIGARGSLPRIEIGKGRILKEAPWADLDSYAGMLRQSDMLLCPMLSPHTSYPVLEMAASGGLAITNVFATKTAERLHEISPNIMAVEPNIEAFTAALIEGAARVEREGPPAAHVNLPQTWDESFADAVQHLRQRLAA